MDGPITFDPEKDAANLAKHGVSLAQARNFDDATAQIVRDERFAYGEHRSVAYGSIEGRMHVLVFTRREDVTRIISLRKANAREVRRYGPR